MSEKTSVLVKTLALRVAAGIVAPALCAVDSFRIRQAYSNQSGYSQFIELEEVASKNGQDQLAGVTLKVTNRAG